MLTSDFLPNETTKNPQNYIHKENYYDGKEKLCRIFMMPFYIYPHACMECVLKIHTLWNFELEWLFFLLPARLRKADMCVI